MLATTIERLIARFDVHMANMAAGAPVVVPLAACGPRFSPTHGSKAILQRGVFTLDVTRARRTIDDEKFRPLQTAPGEVASTLGTS
jgi:hypothetical protein